MLLVTRSGTIGKVALVPEHWQGWGASDDLLRILPDRNVEGYLYAWLSSEWAQPLIRRYTYGAVIPHIDQYHLENVAVPLLEESLMSEINLLVLEANQLRYQAFQKEQQASAIFKREIVAQELNILSAGALCRPVPRRLPASRMPEVSMTVISHKKSAAITVSGSVFFSSQRGLLSFL
ncbi:TPA: hypothetical protein ACJVS1_001319 [Salmonella enterica subsp. enterica serovar Montevideo]